MSLTNDQITAQNFKMFYEELRPYLNGTPPTYANMFNRSDLYSTDEKIVGCWIDGKPLWQKVVSYSLQEPGVGRTNLLNVSNLSIELLINARILCCDSSGNRIGSFYPLDATLSNGYLSVFLPQSSERTNGAIIQYTKTTDTAIKVGTGNDYSTEEQIVGSWIDGKPLYQRTWTGLSISVTSGSSSWIVMTGVNIPNGKLIDAVFLTDVYLNSVPQQYWIRPATGNLETINWAESRTIVTITVKYTKTTD